ncbi:MAG: Asp-tRNA(Asn)/Glu-tRNA(Gln) amidotransferase subunit GatC [Dehalococcoidia bacterium]|nr:Asp-tRNA(Asn)/Glu-tRNA(Gln) amidotransferase subunit GatC [Dehalococcoidia bacterium]MSQ17289.1 Asp-tRNA(Asn)/Glu-tRNA(Gln) amidotransferase subunit GatC [Dehalococcoidia bacterium]
MALEPSEVQHIAALARIALTGEEQAALGQQLAQILAQFEILGELDTTDVLPTAHAGDLAPDLSVLRDDTPSPGLTTEDVLSNAPRREGQFFRVRAVLEE